MPRSLQCDTDARNTVVGDPDRTPRTFELRLGRAVDLVAETHDGLTTTLTIRRKRSYRAES